MASPEEQQERLLARFGRPFSAGDVLFRDGSPAVEAYLLQQGRVRLIKQIGSVERSLRVLRPGDLFGESALVRGAPHNSTAVALADGLALALDHSTFQQVLASNAAVGSRVLQQLIRRLRDAEDQIEVLMLRDSHSKVVVSLIKLAQQAAAAGNGDGPVEIAVSPLELSARVGLDVDSVKRIVQQLRDRGYVQIVDENVVLPDPGALRELYGLLGVRDQILGDEEGLQKTSAISGT
ncbi:MAG: Crp/Fnr family transcriptional regulator [Polyangiaceae bacterium]|nr:Crp/Fnr family transcriptional regulator [Polyangiaceae bacterium]MBK8998223.1 Crp/Fnr family transcriptional regulator [Myxococcales bacterium]MCL4748891.1 Crp/Fnr family transcriptional regulator [Myxococcales bacterium]